MKKGHWLNSVFKNNAVERVVLAVCFLVSTSLLVSPVTLAAGHEHSEHAGEASSISASYICPMHPEVTSDKAGRCPKCNMFLVVKEEGDSSETNQPYDQSVAKLQFGKTC